MMLRSFFIWERKQHSCRSRLIFSPSYFFTPSGRVSGEQPPLFCGAVPPSSLVLHGARFFSWRPRSYLQRGPSFLSLIRCYGSPLRRWDTLFWIRYDAFPPTVRHVQWSALLNMTFRFFLLGIYWRSFGSARLRKEQSNVTLVRKFDPSFFYFSCTKCYFISRTILKSI